MNRKIPFLDLRVESARDRKEIIGAVRGVLFHGRIINGPEVETLERKIASRCGRKYAVGVNSGTDALFLTLKSLGIGPGDEVITTALSWIATANAVALTGARAVFADIRDDLNIDPDSVEKLITSRTKAIMPVHYTGKVCDMPWLLKIAKRHGLLIIEDASQAFGALYRGRMAGSFGDAGCFSLNPMKVFAACGEAGIVVTDRKDIYERLIILRYNGTVNKERCIESSLNGRLDTIQAAILLKRLPGVNDVIRRRRNIAARYAHLLKGVVDLPKERSGERDVYYTYTIRTGKRDALRSFLASCGIETKIQHPYLMCGQPAFRYAVKSRVPNAKRLVKEVLCIPCHEKMKDSDVIYVARAIRRFFDEGR
ncbi:MAG: DegT/DnrJ/EryC1/StrS family aminotransferase [Candidatus Omnitrophota bacterium]